MLNHKLTSLNNTLTQTPLKKESIQSAIQMANIAYHDVTPFCEWSDTRYTRIALKNTKDYEIVLMCWNKKQETPIHDHSGQLCWALILNGAIQETLYNYISTTKKLQTRDTITNKTGTLSFIDDTIGIHSMKSLEENTISLHFYIKPITTCNIYDLNTRTFLPQDITYSKNLTNKFRTTSQQAPPHRHQKTD